jgi:hypothetical protein
MATYVNDLRLKEIGTGESSGTWGTETNTNLELIGDALGFGTEGITTNADTHTTTVADGSADAGRAMYIKYTGTLDSACTVTIGPNTINRMHFIENATTGSQNLVISQGTGSNVTIPAGDVKAVYLDGAGSGAAVADAFASLNVVDLKVQDDLTVTDDATIGGTLGVTGIVTLTDDLIIGDGKTIGSASDVDAMTIASNGQVTFSQTLIGTALDISGDIDVDGTTNLDVVDIDGAVDMASTLQVDGAITSSAGATITIADNSAALTVKSTDADSANGPIIDLIRDSASPADSDSLGMLRFKADNDAGEETIVANIKATVVDVSDGSEDGRLLLQTMIDGTSRNRIEITNTEVVVNQSSVDSDFRVESNGDANMLFVDAGNDRVGLGTNSPGRTLDVNGIIRSDGTSGALALGGNSSTPSEGVAIHRPASDTMAFVTASTERLRIDSGGRVMIAETSNSGYSATADDLIVGDNGSSTERGISLGSTAGATIRFNDGADAGLIEYAHSDNSMRLYTAGSERMRIDLYMFNSQGYIENYENAPIIFRQNGSESARFDSGNFGIGGTPTHQLHLTSTVPTIKLTESDVSTNAFIQSSGGNLNFFADDGNSRASTTMGFFADGTELARFDSTAFLVGTTSVVAKCHIAQSGLDSDVLQLTNSNSTRSFGQRITFSTDHNDTTSKFLVYKGNTTDRLVIYSNGNIQNTNNSYGALSDEKLKENIVDATDKLEDLKQVKIRNYNFIGEDKNQIGVIAQELETIFPSMVEDIQDQDAEGNLLETSTKSVKYSVFVPILIKAIQEQQTIIDDLKTRIETLEG